MLKQLKNLKNFKRTNSNHTNHKLLLAVAIVAAANLLSGCAATRVAIEKANLDVQTRFSASVFLDPVAPAAKTVFLQVKNTSDKPDLSVGPDLATAIANKGYIITTDPDAAHYILQANILQVGKSAPTAAEAAIRQGYGAGVGGGLLMASGASYATGNGGRAVVAAGLIGALAESIAGAAVKDVYFTALVDLQIKERAPNSEVTANSEHQLTQGTSGSTKVTYSEKTDFKVYQTRVSATANKMNLEFAEALPEIKRGLVSAISGIF